MLPVLLSLLLRSFSTFQLQTNGQTEAHLNRHEVEVVARQGAGSGHQLDSIGQLVASLPACLPGKYLYIPLWEDRQVDHVPLLL